MMVTDCYSLRATPLIHLNRRNGTELLPRCVVGQFRLRTTTVFGRGCSLSVGSSSEACSATVIDGKAVAETIKYEIAMEVTRMKDSIAKVPVIDIIGFGYNYRNDNASYVKQKAFRSVGMEAHALCLPSQDFSEKEVIKYVSGSHGKPRSGVIIELPLPSHLNQWKIFNAVPIEEDIEGIHSGRLAMCQREPPLFAPCTPKGCIELLRRYNVEMRGKRAVVIGKSRYVGAPAFALLQREDAKVRIVDSRTKNPEEITREADIIISAVGQPNMVRGSWIKPGAVVIDVGINPVEDLNASRGYRLVGDVCYEEACKVASAITPVPRGVAPMTIAMLLSNSLTAGTSINRQIWINGSWIKPGAVVIDVGINPVEDLNASRGYRLVGDVCYEEACKVASAITPVPRGVAPMTIAMLLSNSLTAAKRYYNFH